MQQDPESVSFLNYVGFKPVEKEFKGLRIMKIFVQGRNLKNLDGQRDKSDTQVTLKMKWRKDQTEWAECDRTEVIADDLDPNYTHHFNVIFNFGQLVQLQFSVHDID